MAELLIKRKDVVHKVTLDDEDLEKVNALGKWYISTPGRGTCFYAEKQLTPKQFEILNNERLEKGLQPLKKQTILMHRYVLDLISNDPYKDHIIDHIDGNGLNNTKSNLRLCNRSQNAMNKKLKKNSKTGYRGVTKITSYSRGRNKTLAKLKKPWCAYITPKGQKRIRIGYYETPEEAAKAYDEKAKELFGEFAKLNFP